MTKKSATRRKPTSKPKAKAASKATAFKAAKKPARKVTRKAVKPLPQILVKVPEPIIGAELPPAPKPIEKPEASRFHIVMWSPISERWAPTLHPKGDSLPELKALAKTLIRNTEAKFWTVVPVKFSLCNIAKPRFGH